MIEQCLLVFGEPEEPCLLSSPFDRGAVGRELAPFPLDQFLLVVKRLVANRIPALIAIEIEVAGSGHALPQRLGGGVMIGFDSADESIMRDVQFRRHILTLAGHFVGACADRDATLTCGLPHLEPVFVVAGLATHVAPRLSLDARELGSA